MSEVLDRTILDRTIGVLKRELGEEFVDGYTVMDLIVGCAEPGYYDDDTVMVMGNWNPTRWVNEGGAPLTDMENLGPRLADMLEEIGAECEWYDEWVQCEECRRAFRGQPDSYSWTMYGAWVEYGYVCAECLNADVESYLDDYIDNPDNAIVWCEPSTLIENGWEQWEPNDPHQYENGWHPGQTDDPRVILREIKDVNDDLQVVFLIDSVGQFDMRFTAWTKELS